MNSYEVIHGDCIEVLPTLGLFDFIFADPPFNLGRNYDVCNDRRTDYLEWCMEWIELCWDHCDGVMC